MSVHMFALGFCVGIVFWAAILWALDIFNAMLQEILDKRYSEIHCDDAAVGDRR